MASLSLSYDDLVQELAFEAGWRLATPTGDQLALIDRCIQSGYRRFLIAYDWRFLRPLNTLTTGASGTAATGTTGTKLKGAAGTFTEWMVGGTVTFDTSGNTYTIAAYVDDEEVTLATALSGDGETDTFAITQYAVFDLPADFANLLGQRITFVGENTSYPPIAVTGEAVLRVNLQRPTSSLGRPQFAAVRPKANDGTGDQRYELMLWPRPDQAYTLAYRYQVRVEKLATGLYPLGSPEHSETIKAACMAALELTMEDSPGRWAADYARLLLDSQREDEKHVPDFIGGRNQGPLTRSQMRADSSVYVTYNGVLYGV